MDSLNYCAFFNYYFLKLLFLFHKAVFAHENLFQHSLCCSVCSRSQNIEDTVPLTVFTNLCCENRWFFGWGFCLLVYHKSWQGPTKQYEFLPQCKTASWYSSKVLFYWLKIFRHGKTCDRLCFLYDYNCWKGVRCSSGCNMFMGTFLKPLTTMYAAALVW